MALRPIATLAAVWVAAAGIGMVQMLNYELTPSRAASAAPRWPESTSLLRDAHRPTLPLVGRITAVADVFDALSTKRSYKPAFSIEKCFSILADGRGTHFDSRVLDAFFAAREKIVAIQIAYAEVN